MLIFSLFISVGWGQDCDEGFVWIDDPPLNEYNWDGYNCFYELDLNQDDVYNVLDIVQLVNIVLSN